MKIYVVTSGAYSEYGIEAVFIDKHKAEIYCAEHNRHDYADECIIEEYESSDEDIEGSVDIAYRYIIGKGDRYALPTIIRYTNKCLNEVKTYFGRYGKDEKLQAIVYLREKNDSKALKIARDMFAQYVAEREGI